MTRQQKILLLVIGVLVLILIAVLVFWNPSPETETPTVNNNGAQVNTNGTGSLPNGGGFNTNVSNTNEPLTPPVQDDGSGNLRRVASAFAERYGSFSSTGDFENLLDLAPFMTESLAASTEAYVETQRSQPRSGEYSGTTTRALSATVSDLNDAAGTATVTVNTQRRAQGSTIASEVVYYQELRLTFNRVGTSWLVHTATWLPRP